MSGKIVGQVTGMPGGTHGIVISHATDQGFTDDGKAGQADAFDLKTLKVTKRIKAQPDADGIVLDPTSGHVFVIDGDSGKLTVIDPHTDQVIATIDGGGALEFGVAGNNGQLYVNGTAAHEIVRIDTATNKVTAHWPMPDCRHPRGLAIDRQHQRLFATCGNQIMVVMNASNGHVVSQLPIGRVSDGARFDPERQLVFSSNFDGTLNVISEKSPDHYVERSPVKTTFGARTMALDPNTGRVYLVSGKISVNFNAAPTDYRHRYHVKPNSATLYFLDPTQG
ncbi:MAG: hypothetical protein PF501_06215 [Salinisphaera sp.]|nr:hypothetical protein [Salinisphaera sp.]